MEFKVEAAAILVGELERKTGLVGLLRQVSPSTGDFDELYMAPIVELSDHVQQLPACPEHHADPGGLLRHAVQSAYFALRLTDGAVFGANLPAEERRVVDRDSRRAAFLAALVSPVVFPHRFLTVCSGEGECWSESAIPASLGQWSRTRGGSYVIGWRQQPAEHVRTLAAWLGGNLLAKYWGGLRQDVVVAAMSAIAPDEKPTGQEGPLQKIVRQALAKSVEMAKRAAAIEYVVPDANIPSTTQVEAAIQRPQPPVGTPAPGSPPVVNSDVDPKISPMQQALELPGGEASEDPLSALTPAIRELFEMMAVDIAQDEKIRARVKWNDKGLLIDTHLIEKYGMTAAGVVSSLKKVKLASDSGNPRSILLTRNLGLVLLPADNEVAA